MGGMPKNYNSPKSRNKDSYVNLYAVALNKPVSILKKISNENMADVGRKKQNLHKEQKCNKKITYSCKSTKGKHVKFNDVVQAFQVGDNWKITTFVDHLKSEVEQQARSKMMRENCSQFITRFRASVKYAEANYKRKSAQSPRFLFA